MKILDLRKYFFANTIVLWFYYFSFLNFPIINAICINKEPLLFDILMGWLILINFCIFVLICIFILLLLEILIRKFIIEKRFPNFKINFKFKIPKAIVTVYNIIFSIGFSLASVMFVIALICLIYFAIDTSHPLFG